MQILGLTNNLKNSNVIILGIIEDAFQILNQEIDVKLIVSKLRFIVTFLNISKLNNILCHVFGSRSLEVL